MANIDKVSFTYLVAKTNFYDLLIQTAAAADIYVQEETALVSRMLETLSSDKMADAAVEQAAQRAQR